MMQVLRWAKNNELVHTDSARYKDSVLGVVRRDGNVPRYGDRSGLNAIFSPTSDPNSSVSPSSDMLARKEQREDKILSTREDCELDKAVSKFSRIRPAVIYDHFAGSLSIKDGMWIFVSYSKPTHSPYNF